MKRFMLVLMVALVGGFSKSVAQNTLVATLTHGDEISMFYGVNAFVQAHAAAVDGDVINLSGGKYEAPTITKGITVRGTGINDSNPTRIINELKINASTTERLCFEGCRLPIIIIQSPLNDISILKSYVSELNANSSAVKIKNGLFVNCEFNKVYLYANGHLQFINSKINDTYVSCYTSFINCIIIPQGGWQAKTLSYSQFVNCILYYTRTVTNKVSLQLPSTSSAWNCVAVGVDIQSVFSNLSSSQNCTFADIDIFIDSNPENDLTDEAKATYLGNDGTPVGMYGGVFPYNMTPTYPTITKMNVANRTTADGKLSVEIEVSAAE